MVEAVLKEKKVAFEYGTQKRMETETDTGKTDHHSRSSLITLT